MKDIFIIDIVRTPVGKFCGTLATVRPDDLAAHTIQAITVRNSWLPTDRIEDVIFGAANQAGEDNRNVARMALLLAGLPEKIAGMTVNRLCASGLQAISSAAASIRSGEGNIYLAGGAESMTRAPYVLAKSDTAFSRKTELYDTTLGWRFINPVLAERYYPYSMGETAENVAEKYKIGREEQDLFAHASQLKYHRALEAEKFKSEIVPILVPQKKSEPIVLEVDEHPRLSSPEQLAKLAPAFKKNGTVTAGNASGINDGAACALIVGEEVVKEFNLKPLARVVATAVSGVDPAYMGIGPVSASQKALQRAGLSMSDIGLTELNEAFASQVLACMRELDLDPDTVNVNGGAIAIGHPLGASGVRISATLIYEMQRRNIRYGLATMCVGVGQGAAVVYEKC